MKDRDFLVWIHQRMTAVYHEDPLLDYMGKLRGIIRKMDPNTVSHPFGNDLLNDMPDVLIPFRDGTAG